MTSHLSSSIVCKHCGLSQAATWEEGVLLTSKGKKESRDSARHPTMHDAWGSSQQSYLAANASFETERPCDCKD
jgi:hypothetical protein